MTKTAADLVADALSEIREIAPKQFARDRKCVLIDVREPAEFATGHIDGAINIPRGVLEFQVDADPAVANVSDPALSHKEQAIVIYCRTGGRAALAVQSLQRLGFSDVCSIAGGITGWADAGLPVRAR
ncbi:MAG: rhodanese-like domain-containing protein [Dokdonella sp.]